MWLNSSPGISGTIPRISGTIPGISGTIPGISGTKKSLSRKRLYRRMMTAEPLPRSLNLKKEYIPGKKDTIWKNLFFPFVPFFFAYFGVSRYELWIYIMYRFTYVRCILLRSGYTTSSTKPNVQAIFGEKASLANHI